MDCCVILSRWNIPNSEGKAKSLCWIPAFWGGEMGNREAWQELTLSTVSPLKAVLNDFRVLCYLKMCVSKLRNRLKTAAMLQFAENTAHRKNPQRATETGGSCFDQEILLYQIHNISFVHRVPWSPHCFEMVHPTKTWEYFLVLPLQLVQLQGRRVM